MLSSQKHYPNQFFHLTTTFNRETKKQSSFHSTADSLDQLIFEALLHFRAGNINKSELITYPTQSPDYNFVINIKGFNDKTLYLEVSNATKTYREALDQVTYILANCTSMCDEVTVLIGLNFEKAP